MRLTKSLADTLVDSIMQDVPKKDYAAEYEKRVKQIAFEILPTEIQNLPKELFDRFIDKFHYWPGEDGISSFYLRGDTLTQRILNVKVKSDKECDDLLAAHVEQRERLRNLKAELRGAISACNTDKQFRNRFPEFAKYLPEETKTASLPTVPIVEHLKAAGWKGE